MAFIPRLITKFLDLANLQRHNDNFSDIQTELDKHDLHVANKNNPHDVTAAQIGAETPIGAQSKATAVQNNLDTHTSNTGIHTTQTEKDKLADISAGAEVNQNAFSKVSVAGQSDVDAESKTDTLNIAGGIGITVTTNPTTDTVTITATGTAAPGAHASTHVTGGSDVIPDAIANGNSGLMSGEDKADMAKIYLSNSPPLNPSGGNTWWLEDMGETPDLGGGGGLIIGNASMADDDDVWFAELT
ncbi:hypothetical protein BK133_05075 [Paenibacillus sp. FSL H8-0548]|uniref:hypothetical protein n=1 Tax=Paenibacillus sp. FSL H8-0548 TaxID=1920422 RepID=UPI00097003FE|nr:hypothetical protein [Paenibacillus sp. FSL H8-0548]OMF37429.1 hypothetical protein BK133_05075 [Paenibacillus sp. FSL H8-0548]